ncbi:uncharacterized protein LOC122653710 [Telopea speciosissima]|uniref:uncharacterized protein LOC122653710 n=1 Tax=Telopea speciosissima TaxID=54955 RepID=UPI001CC57848|nr:uncharacterized protein LOC122653710 [Telopea speciosissima]
MEDYRSKSYGDGRMQMENYYGGRSTTNGMQDLRSYSTSYASSSQQTQIGKEVKIKKVKSTVGSSIGWSFNDPELQRKKRVASYKVYSVEGKMKGSLRKSFKWLKDRYTQVVYGWW